MYCLDTNIAIDVLAGEERLKRHLHDCIQANIPIFVTPVTVCELYRGAYSKPGFARYVEDLEAFLSVLKLASFDQRACKHVGRTYAQLKRKGKITEEPDLLIAAIAKAHDLTLITRDKKHFQHTGVQVEVW